MFPTIAMAHIVVWREESLVAGETLVLLVFGLEVVATRSQMCVLSCFVRAKYYANLALPRLVDGLVVRFAYFSCFFVSDRFCDVLLHRQRDHLDR